MEIPYQEMVESKGIVGIDYRIAYPVVYLLGKTQGKASPSLYLQR
jgi:hypothetical protein